jgi:hypothetical protein
MPHARAATVLAAFTMFTIVSFSVPSPASAARTPSDKFVRIANNYMKAGITLPSSEWSTLAKYDVIVLPVEAQIFNPDFFANVRRTNPDIIILAYVPTKSYAKIWSENPLDTLHPKLKARTNDAMRLRSAGGQILSVWPGTETYNVSTAWTDALTAFIKDDVMTSGKWDGIFFDETSATISWLNGGDVDVNNDGRRDDAATADRLWKEGMIRLLKNTRDSIGAGPVIITNGDSERDLQPYVNGRMFETFPTPWEYDGSWATVMGNYLGLQKQVGYPPLFIINSNTGNTGNKNDFKKVRFGLASTLLGDGFFEFDFGDNDHGQLWMYDEYEAYLGKPVADAKNLTGSSNPVRAGVWRRDFQHGTVLVNSSNQAQTIDLDADFERLHGTQDPRTNDGSISSVVTIPAQDGLLLLRPLEQVNNASYKNGAFTRVLTNTGAVHRNGFFAYDEAQKGGVDLVRFQDASGAEVTFVARGNRLEAYDTNGRMTRSVAPFGESWNKGLSIGYGKAGGRSYIAVGATSGNAPYARLYNDRLEPVTDAFLAYGEKFKGGVNVAVGDLDNDGSPDIVTGAGAGGGPHVRVFGLDQRVKSQFFAYNQKFTGGVFVAMGDVDGDGLQEVVTGPGFGGGPHVRVWNRFAEVKSQFFAFDSKKNGGARVSVGDLDGDGRVEILAMTNDVFTLAFNSRSLF